MTIRVFLIALPLFLVFPGGVARAGWIDSSQAAFFPAELGSRLRAYGAFPLTWWNFLIFDTREESEIVPARDVCRALRAESPELVAAMECDEELGPYVPVLAEWARDIALRIPRPGDGELRGSLDAALAKASLPLDRTLLGILRFDPLETYRELRTRAERRGVLKLARREGVFFDSQSRRIVFPLKLTFPPAETGKTGALLARLDARCGSPDTCRRWGFIGTHASTLENRERIHGDMGVVSGVGTALLLAMLAGLVALGRWRLLLMAPVVLAALATSVLATIAIFGSIHGLTLSFGTGIVGLALDYGLHLSLNPQEYVWRSNFFGLITTQAVLLLLALSDIPLLRQMMVFSAIGLAVGFAFLYLAHRSFGLLSPVKPFAISPRPSGVKLGLTAVLLLGAPVGLVTLRPAFELASFNYQTQRSKELTTWFFHATGFAPPLFRVTAGDEAALGALHDARQWAETSGIEMESIASFLPRMSEQRRHLASWMDSPCDEGTMARFAAGLAADRKIFFEPFLSAMRCDVLAVRGGAGTGVPAYAADFSAEGKWLSLFFATGEADAAVKAKFPDVTSLRELVDQFPAKLMREIAWMAPASFLIVWIFLFLYYRRVAPTLLAFLPFLTGTGLFAWACLLFDLPVSFVSLVGLVMLYGLSVDLGIFATDATRMPAGATPGAWTAIVFATATTVSGFLPLVFCKHQVLVQLGHVLTIGTVGTLIGALWGVPALAARLARPEAA